MKTLTHLSPMTLLAVALIGCGSDAITLGELIEAAQDGNEGSPSDDGPTTSGPPNAEEPAVPVLAPEPTPVGDDVEVLRILRQYCGECHGGGAAQGELGNIDDLGSMIAIGRIIPGDKEDSPIYTRMLSQTMPPAFYEARPSDSEIFFIGEFIDSLPE